MAGHNVDELITYGELSINIDKAAECNKSLKIRHFDTREEVDEYLDSDLKEGDTVLFKGSRGAGRGPVLP